MEIDSCEEEIGDIPEDKLEERIAGHKFLQLKGNVIPRGLVPLERLFNKNDVPLQPNKVVAKNQVEDLNLGTEEDPKIVKLSRKVPDEYKQLYQKLF